MAGGGGTISEEVKAINKRLGDLRLGGAVFCVMCEWDEMPLSDLEKKNVGGIEVYVCPTCGEVLALVQADGRVIPWEDYNPHKK